MHSRLFFCWLVTFIIQVSAQSSCTTTKYPGIEYKGNNILKDDTRLVSYSFDDCVQKCLDRSNCNAINFIETEVACYILSAGIANITTESKDNYYQSPRSLHAYVTCTVRPTQPPTSPVKPPKTVGCGKQSPNNPPRLNQYLRVINGIEARPHSWPWMGRYSAYVGKDPIFGDDQFFGCGSTLLRIRPNLEKSDLLLTAGHCVLTRETMMSTKPETYAPSNISVVLGSHDRNQIADGEVTRNASAIRFHPDFHFTPENVPVNDLALVKLDTPVKFTEKIRPICLPSFGETPPIGKICVAAGWGRVSADSPDKPFTLQQVLAPVHNATICKGKGDRKWDKMYQEEKEICAGTLKGTSGTCEGDSGGMLACLQPHDSTWTLYGITSFGVVPYCVEPGLPAIFTRVSSFMDWISKNMKEMTSL